ncbi:hypothetical protein TRVL_09308 [Trypanosoma vivax]|nr:hypothetical protein TRVL_09308 [Trypanosoma vivax]
MRVAVIGRREACSSRDRAVARKNRVRGMGSVGAMRPTRFRDLDARLGNGRAGRHGGPRARACRTAYAPPFGGLNMEGPVEKDTARAMLSNGVGHGPRHRFSVLGRNAAVVAGAGVGNEGERQ